MTGPEPVEPEPIPAIDLPHPLTADIDFLSAAQMAPLLMNVEREVFAGAPTGEPALGYGAIVPEIESLGREMASIWSAQAQERILLAGGETHGRLAGYLAMRFNEALSKSGLSPCFVAEIPGGVEAYTNPGDDAEFDFEAGAERWYALKEHGPVAMTIGMSPDFSTPFVCSLLDSALAEARGRIVFLGFINPEEARKDSALPDGRSARDLIRALKRMPQGRILSIPLGPEPILGSTRTKSGAAALAVMIAAFLHGFEQRPVEETFDALHQAAKANDALVEDIAELIEIGGQVVGKIGRLLYLGRNGGGLMGLIDSAECVSFFSGSNGRIRGYCIDTGSCGLESLPLQKPSGGRRIKIRGLISEEAFRESVAQTQLNPTLTVAVEHAERRNPLLNDLIRVAVHSGGFARKITVPPAPHESQWLGEWAWEFAARLALNAFSDGAQVLAGKTYSNRMIDMRMNTVGQFDQAVETVADIGQVPLAKARQALIWAIHRGDPDPRVAAETASHLAAASGRSALIARALLLANGAPLQDALTLQVKEPIVRKALKMLGEGQK